MSQSDNCRKVLSLLALYIDDKLDVETREFVENHLRICPACNKKYVMMKELITELRNAYKQFSDESASQEKKVQFNIKEHERFQDNLSAYFDNELPLEESLSMKKYMIKIPKARRDLENLYHLHNIINSSFCNTKKLFNNDYSRLISYRLQGKTYDLKRNFRLKVATYAASILLILVVFFYNSSLGKTVIDKGLEFLKRNIYVTQPSNIEIVSDVSYP